MSEPFMYMEELLAGDHTPSRPMNCPWLETCDEHELIIPTPLLEVFSVEINNEAYKRDHGPCHVWGLITILDKHDKFVSEIYRRNEKDPDMVLPGGLISLNSPDYLPSVPSSEYKMSVFLMDGSRNLANHTFSFSDTTRCCEFERMKVAKVKGEDGYAIVRYCAFEAAVMATIEEFKFTTSSKPEGSHQNHAQDICAVITAKYDHYSCVLFDNQLNKSRKVELETPLDLSKSKVVVPAYSSLILEVHLWNKTTEEKIAHASATFEACCNAGHAFADVETKLEDYLFQDFGILKVSIRWRNMHEIVYEKSSFPMNQVSNESVIERLMSLEDMMHMEPSLYEARKVEMFSAFVGPNNDNVSRIHGTIEIEDDRHKMFIFEREKDSSPEEVEVSPNHRLLSINEPCHSLDDYFFNLTTDLMDEDGPVVSKGGQMTWREASTSGWFNQPLSSVILGDHGNYAAGYYSIFKDTITAKVNVSFLNSRESNVPISVWGTVVGRYGCLKNSEPYDKEFYHMTLFSKPMEDFWEYPTFFVGSCSSDLKLLKSLVSVPTVSSLIVDVDLVVAFRDGYHVRYTLTKEFKPHHDDSSSEHKCTCDLTMTVSVKWGEITCDKKNEEMEAARQMLWALHV